MATPSKTPPRPFSQPSSSVPLFFISFMYRRRRSFSSVHIIALIEPIFPDHLMKKILYFFRNICINSVSEEGIRRNNNTLRRISWRMEQKPQMVNSASGSSHLINLLMNRRDREDNVSICSEPGAQQWSASAPQTPRNGESPVQLPLGIPPSFQKR
jgi:hypothetical protein